MTIIDAVASKVMFRTLFIFGGFVGLILVGRILAFVKALWHPAAEFLVVPIVS